MLLCSYSQSVRKGVCDRRVFGPIAIALRDGPHEAASVREVARTLSKVLLGRDATGETSDPVAQIRWMLYDGVRRCMHPNDGAQRPKLQRAAHPHTSTLRARRSKGRSTEESHHDSGVASASKL